MNDKSEPQVAPGDNPDSSGCHASTKRDDAHAGHAAKQALPSQRPSSDSSESSSRALIEESATFAHFALTTAQAAADHLSDYELVQEISRADSLQASWTAHRLALIARLHQRPVMLPPPTPEANSAVRQPRKGLSRDDLTATEIAPALHISEDAARRLLNRALTLTQRLPNTLDLYSGGLLNESRAHAVADLVGKMADWAYAAVLEEDGSPRLAEHAATALAGMVEKRVLKKSTRPTHRPAARQPSARHRPRRTGLRRIDHAEQRLRPGCLRQSTRPGRADGLPRCPSADHRAKACYSALSVRAQALRDLGDLRTLDQLRADFLVQAILNPRQASTSRTPSNRPAPTSTVVRAPKAPILTAAPMHRTPPQAQALQAVRLQTSTGNATLLFCFRNSPHPGVPAPTLSPVQPSSPTKTPKPPPGSPETWLAASKPMFR